MWKHRLLKLLTIGFLLTASSLAAATVSPSPLNFKNASAGKAEMPKLFKNHKKLFALSEQACGAWVISEPLTALACHSPFYLAYYVGQESTSG